MVEGSNLSSSSEEPSTIHTSLDKWAEIGQPCLNNLLMSLQNEELLQDETLKILVFQVIGAYTYEFSKRHTCGDDLATSHQIALSTVMLRPAVTKLVDRFMSDMVSSQVKEMI
jgi:hypothetical protein